MSHSRTAYEQMVRELRATYVRRTLVASQPVRTELVRRLRERMGS